eukprot:3753619-Alexandrium_andersonii.AAC.1
MVGGLLPPKPRKWPLRSKNCLRRAPGALFEGFRSGGGAKETAPHRSNLLALACSPTAGIVLSPPGSGGFNAGDPRRKAQLWG